jgi:hypothetical protein
MKTKNSVQKLSCYAIRRANAFWIIFFFFLFQLASVNDASATNPNFRLCFTQSSTPTIDGNIDGDDGWRRSWRYVFGNATSFPDAIVQGTKDSGNLFFSFEVNNDPSWDNNDVIVLTIDPALGGSDDDQIRIHIFPVFTGTGAAATGVPREVKYWKKSGGVFTNQQINPTWLDIKVTSLNSGSARHWYVEVRFPLNPSVSGINIPTTGDFGLYFNVIRVEGGVASEFDWPPPAPPIGDLIEFNTPPVAEWGNGTRGGSTCNGVSIASGDITTNNTPNNKIDLNGPNIFTATPHNSSIDATGTPVAAANIRARFMIANWGIPGATSWGDVPTGNNPTPSPGVTIPVGGSTPINTLAWTLTATQRTEYAARPHQCIRVELFVDNPATSNTTFINHNAQRNMDFVDTTSPFTRQAFIDTKGYKLPEGSQFHELILNEFTYNTEIGQKWQSEIKELERIKPGQYQIRLPANTDREIGTTINPPKIKLPTEGISILPGTGGQHVKFSKKTGRQPIAIDVRQGNVITLTATGRLEIKGPDGKKLISGPNGGFVSREPVVGLARGKKLLVGSAPIGAIVGSFDSDNFKNGFIVGSATTVRVPKGAKKLYLAINDAEEQYNAQTGEGYQVQVVQTPYNKSFINIPQKIEMADLQIPLGANLPTWMLCGQRKTGEEVIINETHYDLAEDIGCFGYMVKSIGPGEEGEGPKKTICGHFGAYSTLLLGLGVFLLGFQFRRWRP